MYKRILVPLDGSRLAEAPLRYAVWLAKKTGAELVLMHVFGGRVSDKWSYLQKQAEDISQQLQVEGGPPANVKLVDVSGDPASLIIEYANENQVDLIAMSTHGHTGIRHWLLGSVADKVVNYSMKPIWLVKSFEDPMRNLTGRYWCCWTDQKLQRRYCHLLPITPNWPRENWFYCTFVNRLR